MTQEILPDLEKELGWTLEALEDEAKQSNNAVTRLSKNCRRDSSLSK